MKISSSLIVFILLSSAGAQASDSDVCAIRPDLCDSPAPAPTRGPASVPTTSTKRQSASTTTRRPSAIKQQMITSKQQPMTTPSARANPNSQARRSARCRRSGESYSLRDADLPLCRATQVAQSTTTPAISFESYLTANAADLVHHAAAQKIFQDTSKPVSFGLPNVDGGSVREGDVTQAAAQPQQAAAPSPGLNH